MKHTLLASIGLTIISFILYSFGVFAPLDNYIYDSNFHKKRIHFTEAPIIILAIDDYSIEKYEHWPWSRSFYVSLIKILLKEKAKVIAFNINLDAYLKNSPDNDLIRLIENPKIILTGKMGFINKKATIALSQPYIDKDNVIRKSSLLSKVNEKYYPYFATLVAAKYFNNKIREGNLKITSSAIYLKDITIPLDKNGKILINYVGNTKSFPTIPIAKLMEKNFFKYNPELLENKIVLIGSTSKYLHNHYPTPTSLYMPKVEIQANIINTIVSKKNFRTITHLYYLIIIFIPTFLVALTTYYLKPIKGIAAWIATVLSFVLFSHYAFKNMLIINIASIIAASFGCYMLIVFFLVLKEEQEKRRIKKIFNQYVSSSVVNELLLEKKKNRFCINKKNVSVLFADIREFTKFSESHTPEIIISQLNEFFNAMTDIVFELNGTLDKFIGDEIMAVWGAPLNQKNHAILAVKAGLKQINALKKLQQKWAKENKTILDIGIGISSGEVIAGSIGAEKHKEYTVIGDTVNLAAKLEHYTRIISQNRNTICRFIISEKTHKLLENKFETNFLGQFQLEGRQGKVKIWEVLGEKIF